MCTWMGFLLSKKSLIKTGVYKAVVFLKMYQLSFNSFMLRRQAVRYDSQNGWKIHGTNVKSKYYATEN